MTRRTTRKKTRRQRGRGVDIQKWIGKTGLEFHWPGYQYMGPGTKLEKRLKRGDPGINRAGPHCQTARHRLQSRKEFARQVESGRKDDQGD